MRWRTSPEQNRPLLGNSVGWIKVKFLSFVTSCEPRKFQTILQRNPLLAPIFCEIHLLCSGFVHHLISDLRILLQQYSRDLVGHLLASRDSPDSLFDLRNSAADSFDVHFDLLQKEQ